MIFNFLRNLSSTFCFKILLFSKLSFAIAEKVPKMLSSSVTLNNSSNQPTLSTHLQNSNNTDCSITTDDEDSDNKSNLNYKERRREAHTMAEQKRR